MPLPPAINYKTKAKVEVISSLRVKKLFSYKKQLNFSV
jgi:hypothetical protein